MLWSCLNKVWLLSQWVTNSEWHQVLLSFLDTGRHVEVVEATWRPEARILVQVLSFHACVSPRDLPILRSSNNTLYIFPSWKSPHYIIIISFLGLFPPLNYDYPVGGHVYTMPRFDRCSINISWVKKFSTVLMKRGKGKSFSDFHGWSNWIVGKEELP